MVRRTRLSGRSGGPAQQVAAQHHVQAERPSGQGEEPLGAGLARAGAVAGGWARRRRATTGHGHRAGRRTGRCPPTRGRTRTGTRTGCGPPSARPRRPRSRPGGWAGRSWPAGAPGRRWPPAGWLWPGRFGPAAPPNEPDGRGVGRTEVDLAFPAPADLDGQPVGLQPAHASASGCGPRWTRGRARRGRGVVGRRTVSGSVWP